ncbi:bifunctional UDP-N-acetylglucosamine diphosphorylase/glucosamine-1-phosphate N-acetyltransferase GlmU [Pseudahrensia aquimaris]|uniref:Bifunctional protein GlmU n=1 Tax=Pseudahrensia aquimaris TaxID=744461 RepID=A0ABW3FIK2_9HYPH
MSRTCLTIILAAGEGKRMASAMPKVLHPVAGLSMVGHVIAAAKLAGSNDVAVVVGNQAQRVSQHVLALDKSLKVYEQTERKGTAHAVLAASEAIQQGYDDIIILFGDVPLLKAETLATARQGLANGGDIIVCGFETATPHGYGRMIMDGNSLVAIREHKDASEEERQITFCNSGIMAFRGDRLLDLLTAVKNDNEQGEYYLPDTVQIGVANGLNTMAVEVPENDTLGVNDRVQLARVSELWQARKAEELMRAGVTISAPSTVLFQHDTVVEPDAVLEPNIVFDAGVIVKSGATIRSFSHLEGTIVSQDAVIGPFARLRPGTVIEKSAKVGNFVETKNTVLGEGAKINHLSYIGDAKVGTKANIGAGTVTCNYDGVNKHATTIGAGAFIGTNSSLVAPIEIGRDAMTAAGSVVTKDVPDEALAVERSEQKTIKGLAAKIRKRNQAIKNAKKA